MKQTFTITTPQADEQRTGTIIVNSGVVVSSTIEHCAGIAWPSVRLDILSRWKLWSTEYKDNVYPTIEETDCQPVIVAFLQNMWVRDPKRVLRGIETHGEEYRRMIIKYALFAGCVTGRRLEKAFGNDLCEEIIWDETTREIADNPRTIFPVQHDHILKVLDTHKPDAVLTFGKIAEEALKGKHPRIISGPHPAARFPDIGARLNEMAVKLRAI